MVSFSPTEKTSFAYCLYCFNVTYKLQLILASLFSTYYILICFDLFDYLFKDLEKRSINKNYYYHYYCYVCAPVLLLCSPLTRGFSRCSVSHCDASLPPGWDKHSYGYHGDDGHSFCSSGTGQPYGPTFTTGDVIGCCVNLINNTCFYTKNGHSLGREAFVCVCVGLFFFFALGRR